MSDHIDRAAEAIHHEWVTRSGLMASSQDHVRAFAERLDAAGLLVTSAHDAAVIRAALRPLRDYARQKGNLSAVVVDVDTSEILQAMANDLNRLMDRLEREGAAGLTEETRTRCRYVYDESGAPVDNVLARERRYVTPWEPDERTDEERSADAIAQLRHRLTGEEP